MGSEPDDSDLRERIAELEATVEQQQQTIRKMLPGRRSALKAGGLLAGGGLLGAAGSERARAADGTQDTSDGTVRGNGGGVDIRLDEARDPGGDEVFDFDDTGAINAAVSGREWKFDSVNTEQLSSDSEPLIRVFDDGTNYVAVLPDGSTVEDTTPDILDLLDSLDNQITDGHVIHVARGDYGTSQTVSGGTGYTIETDDTTLRGEGAATRIRNRSGATDDEEGAKLIDVKAPNVTLKDFLLDGNWQNQTPIVGGASEDDGHNISVFGDNLIVNGVRSVRSTGDGLEFFAQANGATVTNCLFLDNFEHNFQINSGHDITLSNSVCQTEQLDGQIQLGGTDLKVTDNVVIDGVLVLGGQQEGIDITPGKGNLDNVRVSDTVVVGTSGPGVLVQQPAEADGPPTNVTVDVDIYDCGSHAIDLQDGDNIDITARIRGTDSSSQGARVGIGGQPGRVDLDIDVRDGCFNALVLGEADRFRGDITARNIGSRAAYINANNDMTQVDMTVDAENIGTDTANPAVTIDLGGNSIETVITDIKAVSNTGNTGIRHGIETSTSGGSISRWFFEKSVIKGTNLAEYNFGTPTPDFIENATPEVVIDVRELAAKEGNEGYNDGTLGSVGPHVYDGSSWQGYAGASGSTI